MEDFNVLYKIAFQLMLNKCHCRTRYDEALEDLGEDDNITKFYEQQLSEAEEAIKLFDELKKKLLEGGEADAE